MNEIIHTILPFQKGKHQLRRCSKVLKDIQAFEESYRHLSPEEVTELSMTWKAELSALKGKSLDTKIKQITPQAFALARTAARQITSETDSEWNMIHYDVQLLGGLAMMGSSIAEMATGEGKTLAATLPVYVHALCGRGAHVVTVNDFLATRDSQWMGLLFQRLGLSFGCVVSGQTPEQRKEMYAKDITYGTASEFGFDYLRDNSFTTSRKEQVQRGHFYALIDEADSILIDEARVPLIISAPGDDKSSHGLLEQYRSKVETLVAKQDLLCKGMIDKALTIHQTNQPESDAQIGELLYQVSIGAPLHPGLKKAKEDPSLLRLLERTELSYHRQDLREAVSALKEKLYFSVSERQNTVDLSEMGRRFFEEQGSDEFTVPDLATLCSALEHQNLTPEEKLAEQERLEAEAVARSSKIHQVGQLLRAYSLYTRDIDYLVKDGEVIILDQDRGLAMPGRRWSDGLHQAIEAKEGVEIQAETETTATISIQNYFRLYQKVGGMTGTASTDSEELADIYGVSVIEIPPNRPNQRTDLDDRVYKTRKEKFRAVVNEIRHAHQSGQPVLVGTASVSDSERVSKLLKKINIPHSLLNAKNHASEADIVARAGSKGAVTISTNMAGRGTDIKLGEGIAELGGLYVIGTERHESRRVDRQLRGRCARQGDPGKSCFFISFEDDLLRQFGSMNRMVSILEKIGHTDGTELSHPMLNKSVEKAQRRVEKHHYESRKQVLKYDNVLNNQRLEFYTWKNTLLDTTDPYQWIEELIKEVIPDRLNPETNEFEFTDSVLKLKVEHLTANTESPAELIYESVLKPLQATNFHHIDPGDELRSYLVSIFNQQWKDHLDELTMIREGIHLWAHAQKDPILEYRRESAMLFNRTQEKTEEGLINLWLNLPQLASQKDKAIENYLLAQKSLEQSKEQLKDQTFKIQQVGRNEPCPCGSSRKFKKCCASTRSAL